MDCANKNIFIHLYSKRGEATRFQNVGSEKWFANVAAEKKLILQMNCVVYDDPPFA